MWPFRSNKKELRESQQAILDATSSLRDVKSRDAEVHEVSGALKTIRERNHLAEQLRVIMERG
jgi:hypothetical protein